MARVVDSHAASRAAAARAAGRTVLLGLPDVARGMGAGFGAGLVFLVFQTGLAAWAGSDLLAPLRMAGAILLGPAALGSGFGPGISEAVGAGVHVVLSILYGGILGGLASGARNRFGVFGLGMMFGFVLWVLNLHFFAPLWFPWFTVTDGVVQLAGHVLVFGAFLGLFLAAGIRRSWESVPGPSTPPNPI